MSAKFQIIIKDIDEKQLGPILGALPDNIQPEIMRVQGRMQSQPAKPRAEEGTLQIMLSGVPKVFAAKELIPIIKANGFSVGSISHVIRRCIDARLVRKVEGEHGTRTKYEKLK